MLHTVRLLVGMLVVIALAGIAAAEGPGHPASADPDSVLGTSFTYQGQLRNASGPITGTCDLSFSLFDAASAGTQIGATQVKTGVHVTNGLFTVALSFGGSAFSGDARFMRTAVRCPAATGPFVTLTPRQALTAVPYALALPGLYTQQNATSPNLVGGFSGNVVTSGAVGATIGGGGASGETQRVTDDFGTVGGGSENQAGDGAGDTSDRLYTTVSGGNHNTASGFASTIDGGQDVKTTAEYTTVAGGDANLASASHATAAGGGNNTASGQYATVAGGDSNTAMAQDATVAGGKSNLAGGNSSSVGGGNLNHAIGLHSTVAGGFANTAFGNDSSVGGGIGNNAGAEDATISGGMLNVASGLSATVGGGTGNSATAAFATIGGGGRSTPSDISTGNRVTDNYGTVGGGGNNIAGDNLGTTTDKPYATVGGGLHNFATGWNGTIGGGDNNTASAYTTTIAGGEENQATADYGAIGGGVGNIVSGRRATVGGGNNNTASGLRATVPGGETNTAQGDYSFAAGRQAQALNPGAFVWADSQGPVFHSSFANQFIVRATGGVDFVSGIDPNGGATAGVHLAPNSGQWSALSDRNAKSNFAAVDPQSILQRVATIPIQLWNYKGQDASIRHIGPMAQDFYGAFGVGEDNRHIGTVDADGVALAAIQGLYQEGQQKDARIAALTQDNAALQQSNRELAVRMAAVEQALTAHGIPVERPGFFGDGAMNIIVMLFAAGGLLALGSVGGLALRHRLGQLLKGRDRR